MSPSSIMPLAGLLALGCAVPPEPLGLGAESGSGSSGAAELVASTSSTSDSLESGGFVPDPSVGSSGTGSSSDGATTAALTASTTEPGEGSTTGDGLVESTGAEESTGIECAADAVECGAVCCGYQDEVCVSEACGACELVADFDTVDPGGWISTGDWGTYTGAPESPKPLAAVPFGTVVYGSDGNRTGMNPMDMHVENSEVLTHVIVMGDRLRFRSWHVDEGGTTSYDSKIVSLFDGLMNHVLVDCYANIDSQAFCQAHMGPRAAGDWDDIVLDTSAYSGQSMQIRFGYYTLNAIGEFEQGWYIDELRVGDQCGDPT